MLPAAAFGRLCVETDFSQISHLIDLQQPPSGGCVLKHLEGLIEDEAGRQPPSGGCVLKHRGR